jgi:hypothetical protein
MFRQIAFIPCALFGLALASNAVAAAPPSYSLTAKEFHDELRADEKAARNKFVGKTIELVGIITSMHVYSDSVAYVTLKDQVGCYVDDPQPWERFGDGQKVRVRGTFTPRLVGIGLEHCTLTAIGECPLTKRTAVEIATEFKKDLDAAKDKYNDRQFLVTGKIAKIDRGASGAATVYFHGADGVSVSCSFSHDLEKRLKSLKAGQQFSCCGTFLRVLGTKEEVGLIAGLPIAPRKDD